MSGRKGKRRPVDCGRILAKKWPLQRDDAVVNVFKKLQMREICPKRSRGFNLRYEAQRFRDLQLQGECDTSSDPLSEFPSGVKMISSARGLVFVLLRQGSCYAFDQGNLNMICNLTVGTSTGILNLFFHKENDSVLMLLCSSLDDSLECKSISIRHIRDARPDLAFNILENERLKWPDIVLFDDVNEKIITCSMLREIINQEIKVFDLKNYTKLYSIRSDNVRDIKWGPGFLVLRFAKAEGHVHLKVLNIEDGAQYNSFDLRLYRDLEPKFIELFHGKLLIKQRERDLQILNICNSELTELRSTQYLSPRRLLFLEQNQLFLTLKKHIMLEWDLQGGDLTVNQFEDHLLRSCYEEFFKFYITKDQDVIISPCKSYELGYTKSININSIVTGRCIGKINHLCNMKKDSAITCSVAEALEDVTAVYYDEERNQIFTGNISGIVHVWSN